MRNKLSIIMLACLTAGIWSVPAYAQQKGRPCVDITLGNWYPATLWNQIDETSYSDSDFVSSTLCYPSDYFEVKLSSVNNPKCSTNHIVSYRGCKSVYSGVLYLRAYLYQGATLISMEPNVHTTSQSFATYTWTLSESEADAITDYSDLRVRCEASKTAANSVSSKVSWVEFAVPDGSLSQWSDWKYKMKIQFKGYDRSETLRGFPVLVKLSESLPDFSYAQFAASDGSDLRFADSNTNEIPYEVETWNTSGESVFWVQAPSIATTNDYIYAYWGNVNECIFKSYTTDGTVWTNGFVGVWHMDEASGPDYDSTVNTNHGFPSNGVSQDVTGQIDGADQFDGFDDTVCVPDRNSLDLTTNLTISAWFKLNDWSKQAVVARKSGSYRFYNRDLGSGGPYAMTFKLPASNEINDPAGNYVNGQWYYCAGTYNSAGGAGNMRLYRNGVLAASSNATGTIVASADNLFFGATDGTSDRFPGIIDEVRISGVTRSSNWIWACWLSQASNSVFCNYGSIDGVQTPPTVSNEDGATGVVYNGATLNGRLVMRGGTNSYVFISWGDVNQDTNKLLWAHTETLGYRDVGLFSTNITGLDANKMYYYRCWATNVFGTGWASSTANFTTPKPVIQFTSTASTGLESVTAVNLELRLSSPTSHWQNVSVSYAVTGGTASNGVDYVLASGTATIPAGKTVTNISVTVTNDLIDEDDETIVVTISSPLNGQLGGNTVYTYTIQDDDVAPTVYFTESPFMAWENVTNAMVMVALSQASARTVSVDYATASGTALAPGDFTNVSGTLTWTPGQSGSKAIVIPIVNDTSQEGMEQFTNTLSSPVNCTISGTNPLTIKIVDDDMGPPIIENGSGVNGILMTSAWLNGNLVATGGAPTTVWVCWGPSNGGTNMANWTNKTVVNVSGLGPFATNITTMSSNTLYYYRCCASNSYSISNGIGWASSAINFYTGPPVIEFASTNSSGDESVTPLVLQLNLIDPAVYGTNVTVNFTVTGGTASNGYDYFLTNGTAVIPAGSSTTNIIITITNDNISELNETIQVTISSPVNGELSGNKVYAYTIIDNDEQPTVSFSGLPYTVLESAANKTISVALSKEAGMTTSVHYATADWTAFDGQDYTNTSGTFIWLPGQSGAKTFTVPVINDTQQMGNIVFHIDLTAPTNCTISGSNTVDVKILDDEIVMPTVSNNGGATNVQWTTATLQGKILTTGGADCYGYFFWGPADGTTNQSSWSNVVSMGLQYGVFNKDLEGLVAGRTYYYRCSATNERGMAWATPTAVFTTLQAQVSGGINYYVNDSSTAGDLYCTAVGNDSNAGTNPNAPKLTIANVISSKTLVGGDCVWIDTGTYNISAPILLTGQDDGTSSKKVYFRGATGIPGTVIDINDPVQAVLLMGGVQYVQWENLRLANGMRGADVVSCVSVNFIGCYAYGNSEYGISMYESSGVLSGNKCYDNQMSGIDGYGSSLSISNNECYAQKEYAGIYLVNSPATVVSNKCYDNSGNGIYLSGLSDTYTASGNECYNNGGAGVYALCRSVNMSGNIIGYNGTYGIVTECTTNQQFYNNIIYWNSSYGLRLEGSPNYALIRNNTIYGGNGVFINDPGKVTNDNNIVWAVGGGNNAYVVNYAPGVSDVFLSDFNNLYGSDGASAGSWDGSNCTALSNWQLCSGRDTNSISANPLLVDPDNGDFHLKSISGSYHSGGWLGDGVSSPSIDAGDILSSAFTNEPGYNGIRLNQGAYGGTWQASKTFYTGTYYSVYTYVSPASSNGTVSLFPSTNMTSPMNSYPTNRPLVITATASDGRYYRWSNWAGSLSGTSNPAVFYATSTMNITAVFARVYYTIGSTAGVNGTISPSGTVSVASGSNITFSITPDSTYKITNVLVNSSLVGATNSYTFSNVLTNHTIKPLFSINTYTMTVYTVRGSAVPSGTNVYNHGSNLVCSLGGSPVAGGTTNLYECTGWVGTGSVTSGVGTNMSFVITNNSTLAWQWRTNYWLNLTNSGSGSVNTTSKWVIAGTNVSIQATPSNGYHFTSWTGGTNTTSNPLAFTMNKAYSLTAGFVMNTYTISVSVATNGTIAPSGTVVVTHGSSTNFTITPGANASISDVKVDGVSIGPTNSYAFANVTNNHTIQALFSLNAYTLAASTVRGSASPSGTNTYNHGSNVVCSLGGSPVTIGTTNRYDCTGWVGTGSVTSGVGTNMSFVITNNSTLAWQWRTNYWLSITAGTNGSVNTTNGWRDAGSNVVVTAIPTNGYTFDRWTGDINSASNPLTLVMNKAYSITSSYISGFTIAATAYAGGTISPSGNVVVISGSGTNFAITPNAHASISDVKVDSVSIGPTNSYTFADVTNNHTIEAWFALDTHTLAVSTVRGSAVPSGTNTYTYGSNVVCSLGGSPVTVGTTNRYDCTGWVGTGSVTSGVGTNMSFAITNNSTLAWQWRTNYWLSLTNSGSGSVNTTSKWVIAGTNVSILATPSNGYHFTSWTGDTNTTNNPLAFTMNKTYSLTAGFVINTYTISVSVATNGTIAPSGTVVVTHGSGTNFIITPNPSYQIKDILVDGGSVGKTSPYAFTNVVTNHTISAQFELGVTKQGTPIWWLEKYGITNNYDYADTNDQDADGGLTWREYLAGTIPTSKISVFQVTGFGKSGSSNYVRWYATTNSGVYTKFLIYRATNIVAGPWLLIDSNLSRSGTGSNVWWNSQNPPAGGAFFYRPALPPTNQ